MRLLRAFMLTITPVLADITLFTCLFALVSSSRDVGMLQIPLAAFVICAAVISLLNCILARRERTVLKIVLVNLAVAILCEYILLSALDNAAGLPIYAVCTLLFLYPAFRTLYLIRRPPNANTMMLYSQAAFFGIACYLLLQYNEYFRPGWGLTVLCLTSQALNLSLLVYLRSEERRSQINNTGGAERWLIFAFRIGLMLTMGTLLAFFMLPGTRAMIMNILNYSYSALLWILDFLYRLLAYLYNLLFGSPAYENPKYEGGGGFLPSGSISQKEFGTNYFLIALFWLLCAAMFRWMIKLIMARLRPFTSNNVRQIKEASPSFWRVVKKKIMGLGDHMRYYSLLLIHFRQPAGVFARLERKGRLCGCPRLPGQTPREFIMTLNNKTTSEETDASNAFSDLAERIDALCFQTNGDYNSTLHTPSYKPLPANQIRTMLRVMRKHRHKKRKQA